MFNLSIFITLSRIALTPVIVFFMVQDSWYVALALFVIAAFTDLLDGFVARRFNQTSKFGQILDPVADKILLCSVMMTMLMMQNFLIHIFYFLLCKEIILLMGGAYLWFVYKKFITPSILSRSVGFLEICFVFFMFLMRLNILPEHESVQGLLMFLLILNVALSFWLLIRYVKIVFQITRGKN